MDDLFKTDEQKEFLRVICEESLGKDPISYFSGITPLRSKLTHEDLRTFVVDDQHLIIIFQPYSVGGGADGPFLVKIPLDELKDHWETSHPLFSLIDKAINPHKFISSWDLDEYYQKSTSED